MSRRTTADHRPWQLCAQVERAVELALGASADPLLQGCWVDSVKPAPSPRRLEVRIRTADSVDIPTLQASLSRATPWLRSEVAAFIHRRRTPELVVVWAGP